MVLNIWEQDNNQNTLLENLFKSMELLKDDYLGGNGSRGYGQISIEIEDIVEKDCNDFYGKADGASNSLKSNYQKQIEKLKS